MASKRKLKRDIHELLNNVIEESYLAMLEDPDADEKKLEAVIDEAVLVMNDLLHRANWGDMLKDRNEVKKHYSGIRNELGTKSLEFTEKLNKLATGK